MSYNNSNNQFGTEIGDFANKSSAFGTIYGNNEGILDPNSDFYKFDKRSMMEFKRDENDNHIQNYRYDVKNLDANYIEKFAEPSNNKYSSGYDKEETAYSICSGSGSENYDVVRELNIVEPVGRMFFSKANIKKLQCKIRSKVYAYTHGKVILEEDQDDSDLLIAMRAMYYQEGRFLPEHIDHQVYRLNIRTLNYILPDLITNIKQEYYYIKEINEPIKPIDRPINDNIRGRKTLRSTFLNWETGNGVY